MPQSLTRLLARPNTLFKNPSPVHPINAHPRTQSHRSRTLQNQTIIIVITPSSTQTIIIVSSIDPPPQTIPHSTIPSIHPLPPGSTSNPLVPGLSIAVHPVRPRNVTMAIASSPTVRMVSISRPHSNSCLIAPRLQPGAPPPPRPPPIQRPPRLITPAPRRPSSLESPIWSKTKPAGRSPTYSRPRRSATNPPICPSSSITPHPLIRGTPQPSPTPPRVHPGNRPQNYSTSHPHLERNLRTSTPPPINVTVRPLSTIRARGYSYPRGNPPDHSVRYPSKFSMPPTWPMITTSISSIGVRRTSWASV